jgi:hypothetical protein
MMGRGVIMMEVEAAEVLAREDVVVMGIMVTMMVHPAK